MGALVVTWFTVALGTRQTATVGPRAVGRTPPAQSEPIPAGLGEGAARLRQRLRAAPRPIESGRNPFRLPAVGERSATLPSARPSARPAPASGGRRSAAVDFALVGIATTETQDGPRRTAVLLRRGEVVLAEPGRSLGGGWTLVAVEADGATFRNVAGERQRLTLP